MRETTDAVLRFVAGAFAFQNDLEDEDAPPGRIAPDDAVWLGLARDYLRTERAKKLTEDLTEAFVKEITSKLLKGLL